ncbi:MAG: hypothetical protein ABII02_02355 [Candidatus Magasanikbacteria bacterium]
MGYLWWLITIACFGTGGATVAYVFTSDRTALGIVWIVSAVVGIFVLKKKKKAAMPEDLLSQALQEYNRQDE